VKATKERIDKHAVQWITCSNLDDARTHVRDANRKTLEAALIVMDVTKRSETKTRRKLIETRLRKLDREAAK
jgi:hypothetical protein